MGADLAWDRENPLGLAEGETAKANQALNDYALLGSGRSISKLAQKYTESTRAGGAPTTNFRVLKRWSGAFKWQDRVGAYDAQLAERDRLAYEQKWSARREAEREQTWDMAQELRQKAVKMLEFPLVDVEHVTSRRQAGAGVQHIEMTVVKPARWAFRDAAGLADTAAKLGRLSVDLPTDHIAIDGLSPKDLEGMTTEELLLLKQQIEAARKGRK